MFTVDSSLGKCRNQIEPTATCFLAFNVLSCNSVRPSDMTTLYRYESAAPVSARQQER